MKILSFTVGALLAGGFLLTQSAPSKASTLSWDFSFSGGGYSVVGSLTTDSTLNGGSPNGYDITSMSGTVNSPKGSGPITLWPGNATPPNTLGTGGGPVVGTMGYTWDNSLLVASPHVSTTGGWLFSSTFPNAYYELYESGSTVYLSTTDQYPPDQNAYWNPGVAGTLDVAQTPLPAALPLFAGGLGLLGFVGWRKKRKHTGMTPAAA